MDLATHTVLSGKGVTMCRAPCADAVFVVRSAVFVVSISAIALADCSLAQTAGSGSSSPPSSQSAKPAAASVGQAALEKAFAEMLSGATLEGSFTSTSAGRDPTKLSREKYTIGQVRKLAGNLWLIPARVQYGDRDLTVPLPAPIQWAGDTPVIVVDNVPGFENMSARVLFFADHYAGYWKHGDHGGHLFGTITRGETAADAQDGSANGAPASTNDSARGEQGN
jgi:hypothetical protein